MIVYVTYPCDRDDDELEEAKRIIRHLQVKNLENCYISPLTALSYLRKMDISHNYFISLCIDILSCCDAMIVTGDDISERMQKELDFARLVKMEVLKLEKDGTLQPFKN